MRVAFCGSIAGSVTVRRGETEEQAISRAEQQLLALMASSAKSLSMRDDDESLGPNICLEPDESPNA